MQELLWLLLPVAAASGWYAARRSGASRSAAHREQFSSDYFKGLNYLLNEQPDKAIEVFVKMVEVDSETVETHLALGNLFRRRGEVDRAIRIHQNLIARPTLNSEQRSQSLLELGEDYMKAGLLDRAENLFQELLEIGQHTRRALYNLLDIYQQEQDWEKAIETGRRLERRSGQDMHAVIAQHYCELAHKALEDFQYETAQRYLKQATSEDKQCVRASIIHGRLLEQRGEYKAAIKSYLQVPQQDSDYLSEVIRPLERCYIAREDEKGLLKTLTELQQAYNGISTMLTLSSHIRKQEGDQAAIAFVGEQLRKRPSLRGLQWLIEISLTRTEGRARENLIILRDLVAKVLEGKPAYECHVCGFSGKALHWQCPSCRTWASVKPIKGVEGE